MSISSAHDQAGAKGSSWRSGSSGGLGGDSAGERSIQHGESTAVSRPTSRRAVRSEVRADPGNGSGEVVPDGAEKAAQARLRSLTAFFLRQEAKALWRRGSLEPALSLMQECAMLCEESSKLCSALAHLARMYVEMLKIDEAEETARRMLREAHRRRADSQAHLARKFLEDAKKEREHGFQYGSSVLLQGLEKTAMNGQVVEIRGRDWQQIPPAPDSYLVQVGPSLLSVQRRNIALATVIVQLAMEATSSGLAVNGATAGGKSCATFAMTLSELRAKAVRSKLAESVGRPASAVKFMLPDGKLIEDDPAGDAALRRYADELEMAENWPSTAAGCKKCGNASYESTPRLRRCPKCMTTFYCSEECRLADLKSHKRACKRIMKSTAEK